jgi:hypothetical protein
MRLQAWYTVSNRIRLIGTLDNLNLLWHTSVEYGTIKNKSGI